MGLSRSSVVGIRGRLTLAHGLQGRRHFRAGLRDPQRLCHGQLKSVHMESKNGVQRTLMQQVEWKVNQTVYWKPLWKLHRISEGLYKELYQRGQNVLRFNKTE